jgi:hypothetical protein
MESTADTNLKPEPWGSPLVQGKYREGRACDKKRNNNNNNNNDNSYNIVLLRDMVCLRNICINTLHKGESIFTYNNNNNNNNFGHCGNTFLEKLVLLTMHRNILVQ